MKYIVVFAVMLAAGCVQMAPITEAKPVAMTSSQIKRIESAVSYDFFDPSGAQFRSIRAVDVTLSDGSKVRRVCGEVNGRNQLGGYVGFQLFGGRVLNGNFVQDDFFGPCEPF